MQPSFASKQFISPESPSQLKAAMPTPEVSTTIRDNALGIVANNPDSVHAKIGVCSLGTPNTIYSFADQKALVDTLGSGPLVEATAHALAVAGGQVLCVPVNASVSGTIQPPAASSGSNVSVTGTPLDAYKGIVQIMQGGGLGAATFKYSLDGSSFSSELSIPSNGTYVLPNTGLTLTFTYVAAQPFSAGQAFAFATTAPSFSTADAMNALQALLAESNEWRLVHVVGTSPDASGSAALAAAVDTALVSAETGYRYVRGIIEGAEKNDSTLVAAFSSFASRRVGVAAGFANLTSSISGNTLRRSAAWPAVARAMAVPISQDLGALEDGPLPGVSRLFRDERATPGLDAKQFITLRTFLGVSGCYVTAGRVMAPAGSDYALLQNGFVMDAACRTARSSLLPFLNSKVRVDATTGYILEVDARSIEATVEAALNGALVAKGHASAVSVKVSRTENILSSQRIPVTIRVVPLGYARAIAVDIGFSNPALKLAV
jgi:hypothetical protein